MDTPLVGEHELTGQLLDAMGIGYAVFAADWTIQHVNTEIERMTGTSGRALVGRNHWEAFPAMAGSDFERHYRRAVATGEVVVFEAFYPAPLDVWAEVRAIPHAGGLQVSVSDVSARHHAQDVSRRAHQRLDGLSALAAALVEADDVTDLLAVVAEQLPSVVGCDSVAVAVVDPADALQLLSHPDGALPEAVAAAADRRVLIPDRTACLAFSPGMEEVVDATGCQAFAHLPLRAATGVIGVLSAGWRGPQAFTAEQLDVLEALAAQCAQGLSRLQARDAERSATTAARGSADQQAALVAVARALGEADSEDDVLAVVATRGLSLLGASDTGLCLREPDGATLRVLTTDGVPGDLRTALQLLPLDLPLPFVQAAATGAAVWISDAEEALRLFPAAADIVSAMHLQAQASTPLRARGQLLGSLTMGFRHVRDWPRAEVELVEAFAALTAQAVERIHARDAEQAATVQQATLVSLAAALGQAQSEAEVFAVVAARSIGLLGAFGSGMCLREPGGRGVRTLATETISSSVREPLQHLPADYPMPLVDTAMSGASHFLVDRAEAAARFSAAEAHYTAGGVQASAQVPLLAEGHLLGSLSLAFREARSWPPADRAVVEAFAALVAQALERLYAREAERSASAQVARFSETLQRSLLTAPPQPDHLQVAVRYSPAAAEAYVGGDWYDAFVTSARTTSVVIGDVTGHDSRAAAAMAQMRNLLRGIGYTIGAPPAAVLSALDRAVHDLGVGALATVVLAQVEQTPEQAAALGGAGLRTLRWSNAGHPAPLLIGADGSARYLPSDPDLLLGLDPTAPRADHTAVLAPGDSVLLFTDGLVERRGVDLRAGLDWLVDAASGLAHLPLEELCDALLDLVGSALEDDVALLALRAHPAR